MRFLAPSLLAAVSLALAPLGAAPLAAQTIFVTTTVDVVDFTGAQTVASLPGPDGQVSMREAVTAANKTGGPQTIGFQVPLGSWGGGTTGPRIANTGTSFTLTDDATTIDGTTQTAFTGDTNPDGAEVSFQSTVFDPPLIQSGTIAVASDHNVLRGLGDMLGRNYGIDILAAGEHNVVAGCTIKAVFAAVRVQGDHNVIGGTAAGDRNRLTSLADGVRIQGLEGGVAEDNVVIGNDLTGEFNGVQITGGSTANRIGGDAPGEGNWIAGAGYFQEDGTPDGAMVRIESDGNFVVGNRIGTDPAGTAVADNPGDVGVELYGDENVVRGNVIGGITGLAGFLSVQAGISLREGAERNAIEGNWIGVDASGAIALPNRIGVVVAPFDSSLTAPADNVIGGMLPGAGNVIAFNEEGGVAVLLTATGNRISGNVIRDDDAAGGPVAIGIDLGGDGKNANDPGDADAGPNQLMNDPRISSAVASAQGTVVIGTLNTVNPAAAALEFFAAAALPGEPAQADAFAGTGNSGPSGSFAVALTADWTASTVAATATDAAGNTSELGNAVLVAPSPWTVVGAGTPGAAGVPKLHGGGTLAPATPAALLVAGALPLGSGLFVFGASAALLPIPGGTLVPAPQVVLPFALDANGAFAAVGAWPGAPSGSALYVQALILDPAGLGGVAASNALQATAP